MQSMQLVFSRSWKLERVVLHLSSVLTPVCFLLFFFLCSCLFYAAPLSTEFALFLVVAAVPSAHAIPMHICAVLYEVHFFSLSSSCWIFGKGFCSSQETYLALPFMLLIVAGLTRERVVNRDDY